mmetsp:Transcript_7880/g.14291  ORF Transcript_7880/g.14291 Transcript_7880/m.14291 type:complete len:307 (-) Transcript_7880:1079-1999(-)
MASETQELSVQVKKPRIVVTGAGGRTGKLILKKLLLSELASTYSIYGVVRDTKSLYKLSNELSISKENLIAVDILNKSELYSALTHAKSEYDGDIACLIIATSAVPKLHYLSLIKMLILKCFGYKSSLQFGYKLNQMPREVDFISQKDQIECAIQNGCKHVILLGTMGISQGPSSFLNSMGNGKIVMWKRKAEQFLVNESGVDHYTVIHCGGLQDIPGGKRQLIVDVDDKIMENDMKSRTISRDDVADVCVKAVQFPELFKGRAFDLASKPMDDGPPTQDIAELMNNMKQNCSYDTEVDQEVAQME